jgi:hypothetical protein
MREPTGTLERAHAHRRASEWPASGALERPRQPSSALRPIATDPPEPGECRAQSQGGFGLWPLSGEGSGKQRDSEVLLVRPCEE